MTYSIFSRFTALFLCLSVAYALKGDHGCGSYLCVNATVVEDKVTYEFTPLFANPVGWVALGFGRHMAHSPMVILWNNDDNSTTVSHRYTSGHREPQMVDSPPRVATAVSPRLPSFLANRNVTRFAFEIPINRTLYPTLDHHEDQDNGEHLIWAFSLTRPKSSQPDTHLTQHLAAGFLTLDITKDLPDDILLQPSHDTTVLPQQHLTPHERLVIAHGAMASIGFLLILPLGSLVARWSRTFTPKWFIVHRLLNFYVGLPVIVIGWLLGPIAVMDAQADHFMDAHQICGFIMLFLYLAQIYLGRYIHNRRDHKIKAHPPSNVLHATFGIVVIVLAFLQVRSGFNEWQVTTGRPRVANWCFVALTAWAIAFPLSYLTGLLLLRRQFYQEQHGITPFRSSIQGHYIALSPSPEPNNVFVLEDDSSMNDVSKQPEKEALLSRSDV